MSAVIAVFNRNGAPVEHPILEQMMNARSERGPDGRAVAMLDHVGLAHQHFWITPEEWGEKQPLHVANQVISCDARLDNREELFRLLELDGKRAKTISDAALIALSYKRWGVRCLEYFRGDFAFVVWNSSKQELFLARDAMGARDVCYFINDRYFVAASEVSQVLAHPEVEAQLNDNRIAARLHNLWDRQAETYYKGISYLPPAHGMTLTKSTVKLWRYWAIDREKRIRYREPAEYGEHYREILSKAVHKRLRTVGPVGISLSGGLDSSTLAALAAPMIKDLVPNQEHLASFSYVFDKLRSCDEREYIRATVARYGLEANYLPCDDKWAFKDLDTWPNSRDALFADPYILLPMTAIKAAGQQGIRLFMAGYYGDTLFTGARYWALDLIREMRWGLLLKIIMNQYAPIDWHQALFEDGLRQMVPKNAVRAYRRLRPRETIQAQKGIHRELVARTDLMERLAGEHRALDFPRPGLGHRYRTLTLSVFSQALATGRHQYNQYGVELAMPYFDRSLLEYVMAIPADALGRPGEERRTARKAMKDLLPDNVLKRQTHTSFLPLRNIGMWDKERETIKKILEQPLIVERKYIDPDWLRRQKLDSTDSPKDTYLLFQAISLELWLRRYWP